MRIKRVENGFRDTPDGKCATATGGMVATAFPDATAAGIELLAQGGNAIDAACAAGLAIGVCEPQASGLGGQSLGMVHYEGRTVAIDGSSRAPSLAHASRLNGNGARRFGYTASTVPSTLATYGWLHRHYGRVAWSDVVAPAVRLAREGYAISKLQHDLQVRELDALLEAPSCSGARYVLKNGAEPYRPGEIFRQPDLANLLELIGRRGPEAFYRGDVAAQIDADMRAHDGLLRAEDLALIPWPVERKPLSRRYRGYLVSTMPPPGSGRTLLLVLLILNHLESRFVGSRTPVRYHFVAEAFRKAFLQRKDRPFDANTYPQIRDKRMLSRQFARRMATSIADKIDEDLPLEDWLDEAGGETTHFSVMDRDGNAVSMTQSIELVYGAKVAAAELGFLYNNYMKAFDLSHPAHPYYLRPNAVPWSSAAPTLIFRRKEPWLALGSPGGERIFSTLAQFIIGVVDGSAPLCHAATEPRFHCSTGGTIHLEQERFDAEVVRHFERLGYQLRAREPYAFYLGCVQAVLRRQTGGGFQGVADVRRDGIARGLDS